MNQREYAKSVAELLLAGWTSALTNEDLLTVARYVEHPAFQPVPRELALARFELSERGINQW